MLEVRAYVSVSTNQEDTIGSFFLSHYAVVKEDIITSKIRVVFEGTSKTSISVAINNVLMVGPKLQYDLFIIISRFRLNLFTMVLV